MESETWIYGKVDHYELYLVHIDFIPLSAHTRTYAEIAKECN